MKELQNKQSDNQTLFQAAHMMCLIAMTVASAALLVVGILLNWEKWPMIPIFAAVIFCWVIHLQQNFSDRHRIIIFCMVLMGLLFYYGIHPTSTFDLSVTACIGIVLCATTGVKKLITVCVITFCISFFYNVIIIISETPELLDALMFSRIIYHPLIVFVVGWLGRALIDLWTQVLDHSKAEIEQLTESTGRFNEFLTKVSHEIRTPINAVLGLSSIALEQTQDKDQVSNLKSIQSAGKRVAEQISDILDYSEIDRQKFAMNREEYMLASLLHDLVMEVRPYMKKGVEMIIDVDPSIPAMLRSDVSKLKKIIWHLVNNAIKFTSEGGVYLRFTSQQEDYGINLIIEISDTGEGMTDKEIDRLFDGYYQGKNAYTRSTSGLGLGMAIVNGYVTALGGFVHIESRPGEGTTVRVTVPQEIVDPSGCISVRDPGKLVVGGFFNFEKHYSPMVRDYYNSMVLNIVKGLNVQLHRVDTEENLKRLNTSLRMTHLFVSEAEYASSTSYIEELAKNFSVSVIAGPELVLPASSKVHIMEKPFYCFPAAEVLNRASDEDFTDKYMYCHGVRALVVDDEPLNLTVARDILGRYDINVATASSGQEAIDLCSHETFDIVFMDHMMPGMDGIEAMRRIRSDILGAWKSVPMVALTANAVSTARESFRIAGFDGFVAKPIDILELERVLKIVLPKTVVTFEDRPHSRKSSRKHKLETESASAYIDLNDVTDNAPVPDNSVVDEYTPLRNLGVDLSQGLLYCQKDEEFYRTLLLQFASEAADKLHNLEKFYKNGDLPDYSILVHALKSTAKMIGATGLSEKAKALEEASKAGDVATVEAGHRSAMDDYKKLTDTILNTFGDGVPASEEGSSPTPANDDGTSESEAPDEDILEFGPAGDMNGEEEK
ncbi:MAG: response regulator [Lachnospiraceae bacterium]|nr:response regulator [Lachnospiraceae bacterium]